MLRPAVLAATSLAAIALLAGCSSPVRLATPAESRQATASQATASPGSGPIVAIPSASPAPGASPAAPSGSGALAQLQNEFHALVDQVLPSIVQIEAGNSLGSGIVLDAQGDIVTNAHVVEGSSSFTVTASDGRTYPASLVGSYANNDLAVIKVSAGDNLNLKPATFADSGGVRVGDIVVAVGSPLGLTDSVSEGIVSGLGRTQPEGNGVTLSNLIQVTAAINPGNSGGALVDISGHVVGIPTLGAGGRNSVATGIAFAIPSNQVLNITKQLTSGGAVTHTNQSYLGISTSNGSGGGTLIASVVAGGPADQAGVKSGWVLSALGGHAVADAAGVSQVLAGFKPGDKISLTARLPDGSTRTVTVTLAEKPLTP